MQICFIVTGARRAMFNSVEQSQEQNTSSVGPPPPRFLAIPFPPALFQAPSLSEPIFVKHVYCHCLPAWVSLHPTPITGSSSWCLAGDQDTVEVVGSEGHGLFFSRIVPCLDVTPTTEAALWPPGKEGAWAEAIRVEGRATQSHKEGSRSPEVSSKASPASPVLVTGEDQVSSSLTICICFLTLNPKTS